MSDNGQSSNGNGGVPIGDIQFYEAIIPPLDDGDYTLIATQKLTGLPGEKPNPNIDPVTLTFSVRGPRFKLNPADIHSVYPSGASTPYEGQIPHLVVSRKTLPWERLVAKDQTDVTPWLALLTIFEDDPGGIPKVASGTVGDLIAIKAGGTRPLTVGGTAITALDDGESLDDPCSYIEVSAGLFATISPRLNELRFLAHARGVNTGNKPIEGIIEDGIYSVVISNRVAHPSVLNAAFLVSLEEFTDLLTGTAPNDITNVRLAVLYSWLFQMGADDPFDLLMSDKRTGLLTINSPPDVTKPVSPPKVGSATFADDTVTYALQSGYAALTHHLREGDRTFSWYRGPLIPYLLGLVHNRDESNPVFRTADELLRYNPESGLFDVTYAAAFQLGRLLALQNEAFLTSLRTYLHQVKGQAFRLASRKTLIAADRSPLELSAANPKVLSNGVVLDATVHWLATNGVDALNAAVVGESAADRQDRNIAGKNSSGVETRLSRLHGFLSDKTNRAELVVVAPPPSDTILRWLANLVLLTGVPFDYLVPDERMLPQESVRFFFVDENWIERLIDGALSVVGGRTGLDQLITDSLRTVIQQPVADSVTTSIRQRLLGKDQASISSEKLNWPLTGFLIRSIVVDQWKGVVIENTSNQDPTTSLTTLRLDQPAQGVLLGLYNGQLGSVTFKHPPESLHFGIDGQPQTWTQKLRRLDTGVYDNQPSVEIKFHNQDQRVIDVCGTTSAIEGALNPKPNKFTSAELAIEMIESPKSVTFKMLYQ